MVAEPASEKGAGFVLLFSLKESHSVAVYKLLVYDSINLVF